MYGSSDMQELIGKTIKDVLISDDKENLVFVTEKGEKFNYQAEGDCCNSVWFNHVAGIDFLFGEEILSIEVIFMGDLEPTRQEVDDAHLYKIETKKGICDIELRNSSNGYYGGSIEYFPDADWDDVESISDDF